MVTTVELQKPFEYSWWVSLIWILLIIVAVAIFAFMLIKLFFLDKKKAETMAGRPKTPATPRVLPGVKNKYIQRVQDINNRYAAGAVSKRNGYQELSGVIREFVHEATGINVETLTAEEVRAMGIMNLNVLMEEYYVPEFAEDERARNKDLTKSCNTAVGVIRSWN